MEEGMSFLKRYRSWIGMTAALALVIGGARLAGWSGCGGSCPLTAVFGSSTAYAGPGCSASKAAGCATKTTQASATTTSGCPGHANVTTAAATTTTATCTGDKEACIAKCMAEKGLTRAEAEACYAKCQTAKAEGKSCPGGGVNMIQAAVATDGKPMHSREACIDACIAKGMTKAEAEACAAKCGTAGFHTAAATQTGDSKAGCPAMKTSCAAAAKAGCCAKAKGSASTTSSETPSGGSK
jgi:hypothetical protein